MTIYFGADHAGFERKERLKTSFMGEGYVVEDLGAHTLDPSDDYPVIAERVARAIQKDPDARGVLLCGNAEGVCMAANKIDGVRAAIGYAPEAAEGARRDDDANILCLPGALLDDATVHAALRAFLATPFEQAARQTRRLEQIKKLEEEN